MNKILIVGQTPPPYHGQAIIIQKIIEGDYDNTKLYHVRMAFSKEINEIGKIHFFKLIHLFNVIGKIYYYKLRYRINTLYYPPSGPLKTPVYRDMIILLFTRWIFKKTIFHFHASGISQIWDNLNIIEKFFFRKAFYECNVAISLSPYVPPDASFLEAKKNVIIPYGVEDIAGEIRIQKQESRQVKILFVGLLRETKGEFVLVEACKLLLERNINFSVDIAGSFGSEKIEKRFFELLNKYKLQKHISYKGLIKGVEKQKIFSDADIFCFPSYYESEAFPLVLIEALQFGLPVVSTLWRGIPGIINNEENGYLVDIKDAIAVADKLEILIKNDDLRNEMRQRNRKTYIQKFTIDKFYSNMNDLFSSI